MFKSGRTLPAFLLAPLAAPVTFFIGVMALNLSLFSSLPDLQPVLGVAVALVLPVSYVALALVGVPAALFLRRIGWFKLPAVLVAGTVLGVLVQSLFFLLLFWDSLSGISLRHIGNWFLLGSALGLAVAAAFWFISGAQQNAPADAPNDGAPLS